MAARAPRRNFASPFVITLAAIPGCYRDSKPVEPPHVNPPPPQPQPAPDPTPAPAPQANREWRITKDKGSCLSFASASCPTAPAGQPQPTCNPPPPQKYAPCPDGMADGASLIVTQLAGQSDCFVMPEPPKCPPNAACNPPPPRKVTCP